MKKTINKLLISGLSLTFSANILPALAFAEDTDDKHYGESISKGDSLYTDCSSTDITKLIEQNGVFKCIVKRENSSRWNKHASLPKQKSKTGIYYLKTRRDAGPIEYIEANDKEVDLSDFKFSLDSFITADDYGKDFDLKFKFNNFEIGKYGLNFSFSPTFFSFQEETNENKYNSSIPFKSTTTNLYEDDVTTPEASFTGTIIGDSLDINLYGEEALNLTDEYYNEMSSWKTPEDIKFSEYTPHLEIEFSVGGEKRFSGPIKAYFPIENQDLIEEIDEINVIDLAGSMVDEYDESNYNPQGANEIREQIKLFERYYYPEKPHDINQNVFANVVSGGLTGAIGVNDLGQGLKTVDVDFGRLKIGSPIQDVSVDNMITVRDWTGGDGWNLTVKHRDVDRNKSLQLGLQVDNEDKLSLNDSEQLVATGESILDPVTKSGNYSADWGTNPKSGEFCNIIEWTLSTKINKTE